MEDESGRLPPAKVFGDFVAAYFLAGLAAVGVVSLFFMERPAGQESAKAADAPAPWSLAVCFQPEGQCGAAIVREVEMAEQEIRVHAYTMTTASHIPEALADAAKRGVKVEVVADKETPCGYRSAVPMLIEAGIPVWIDRDPPIAHEKALIIDGETVVAGSYNWTGQAERNSEDVLIVRSPGAAAQYVQHWQRRRDVSEPYAPGPCPHRRG